MMTTETMQTVDLDAIRERLDAATPGPWFWWGNTDNHNTALCGQQPGLGVCEVISTVNVDRSTTSTEANERRDSLREYTDMDEEAIEAEVHDWAYDEYGSHRSDERLAVTDAEHILRAVEEVAVYEVARAQRLPDDTPRSHPKVYRADICDVRNPNGQMLAHAWQDIRDLIAEVDRLRALAGES